MVTVSNEARQLWDPSASYESMEDTWAKSRAIMGGEASAKAYDEVLDSVTYSNLLIPFSPKMTTQQYNFYKSEAELPGLVSQYGRLLVSGLLRKDPVLELDQSVPAEARAWITESFTSEGRSLISFLSEVLWEELISSRAWISVDYPDVGESPQKTPGEQAKLKPYPVLWKAEQVINWHMGRHPITGLTSLLRLTLRYTEKEYDEATGHGKLIERLKDYKIGSDGYLTVESFKKNSPTAPEVRGGSLVERHQAGEGGFTSDGPAAVPKINGQRFQFIPAWPLNGSIDPKEPILQPVMDREVALYNKVSRRNHLLLGAGTYTPWVASNMSEEEFHAVTSSGLGSWLKLNQDDQIGVLKPPTEALKDYDRAIANTLEEMTRMGLRMLSPETSQSGVALEIRNASQTAQLGMLNTTASETFRKIIGLMLLWRYPSLKEEGLVDFTLSADFNPTPLGADWLRLAGEWYQSKLLPRSAFISLLKQNDLLDSGYDDEEGLEEINMDSLVPQAPGFKPVDEDEFSPE